MSFSAMQAAPVTRAKAVGLPSATTRPAAPVGNAATHSHTQSSDGVALSAQLQNARVDDSLSVASLAGSVQPAPLL